MTHLPVPDVWGGGQLIAFSGLDGPTDYAAGLVARTTRETCGIELMHPARLQVEFSRAAPSACAITGDTLEVTTPEGRTRLVCIDAHHIAVDGPCTVGLADGQLAVHRSGTRTLIATAAHCTPALVDTDVDALIARRRAWLLARPLPGSLPVDTRRTLVKALSVMKSQVCTAEGNIRRTWTTPDRWPHRKMWLWDTGFHVIGWRHVDTARAREFLEAMFDLQRDDGFIPISGDPVAAHGSYTQPPVLTLAAWLVNEVDEDPRWLKTVYPRLCSYIQWDMANRDTDGAGLVEWAIEGNPGCRSGESGADNCSRFDCALQLDAPDFNALLTQECELLGMIAHRIGKKTDADRWQKTHARLCALMNKRLWNEDAGIYMDCVADSGEQTGIMSFAGLLPMVCGCPSKEQAARLAAHIRNPATFGTELPVPTIAPRSAPGYRKDMWCGPVWVNINWLLCRGLRRYGYPDEAAMLQEKTMAEVERQYLKHGCIFEFFDDERVVDPPGLFRKGKRDPSRWVHQVIHDYGWTATLYADMALAGRT